MNAIILEPSQNFTYNGVPKFTTRRYFIIVSNTSICVQEPDRTRAKKARKQLAKKQLQAYKRRKERQDKKEEMKFVADFLPHVQTAPTQLHKQYQDTDYEIPKIPEHLNCSDCLGPGVKNFKNYKNYKNIQERKTFTKSNNNGQVIYDELVKAGVESNPGPGIIDILMSGSRIIAEEIMEAVVRCELPFTLDNLIPGDGNCFTMSVLQQLKRREVFEVIAEDIKQILAEGNIKQFKEKVSKFVVNSSHNKIRHFKLEYTNQVQPVDSLTWDQYWIEHAKLGVWSDAIFIQATAWLCKADIIIVSTSSTLTGPYITSSGNLEDENTSTICPPLILGTKSNSHFQSLLPNGQLYFDISEIENVYNLQHRQKIELQNYKLQNITDLSNEEKE